MCFTILLCSWMIFHAVQLGSSVTSHVNNHASILDISLLIFKNGSERGVSGDEVRWSLEELNANLQDVDHITICDNDTTNICLASSKCPTGATWNVTEHNHDNKNECFMLIHTRDHTNSEDENSSDKPTLTEVWGYGMLSVGIISLSGLFGGLLWPLMSSKYYDHAMRMLIGLAVGTLTATSTMQLVPQGFGMKETDVVSYLQTSVIMLCSLWSLYMFEISCKIFFHSNNKPEHDIEISAQKLNVVNEDSIKQKVLEQEGLLPTIVTDSTNRKPSLKPYFSSNTSLNKVSVSNQERRISLRKSSHTHQIQMGGMAPVAWMVILGDGLHNFVDGMSIGAGFTNSLATGLSISIAIACEEFPHELGDFAILVNSGMPIRKALMYNFLSALTAVAGLVLGILLGELEASTYIFAFSGGLFLYISLTDLMPELNNMIEEGLKLSKKHALLVLLQQNSGILFGFCLLYLISANPVTVSD